MRIVIDVEGSASRIELRSWQPEATVGQLIKQVTGASPTPGSPLYLDDTEISGDAVLRDLMLLEGSRISHSAPDPAQPIVGWSVAVSAGIDTGRVVRIPDHREMRVGRAPGADLVLPTESASWNHCALRLEAGGVRVTDMGSTNGTLIDGLAADTEKGTLVTSSTTLRAGGATMSLRANLRESPAPAPGPLRSLTPAATIPFNRPPRLGRSEPSGTVSPPSTREPPPVAKFNFIAVLLPLVLAGALVLVLGNLSYALFALLGPLLAVGMHFEQRRRRAKDIHEEEERFGAALADFRTKLTTLATDEVRRMEEEVPDPSIVLRRPELPTTSLWHRRAAQPGFLALGVGVGDLSWKPELGLRDISDLDERVREVIDRTQLVSAPVIADLSGGGVIGLTGDRRGCLALARSLLLQASVHCGPADLTIGVFCDSDQGDEWDWASWLPHTRRAAGASGARWMSDDRDRSTALIRGLLENDAVPTPQMFLVIDSEGLVEGSDAPARDLLGSRNGRSADAGRSGFSGALLGRESVAERSTAFSGIVIAGAADRLPASCTTVVEIGADASCTVLHAKSTDPIDDVVLAGVSVGRAEICARSLARFEDPEFVVPGASLPPLVRLPELLDVPDVDAEAVQEFWSTSTGISTPIGLGEAGTLSLDIVKDGPHGLVGGTTGSGKSEFLRSLVAGLAARNDPTRLNFILIDFKGGAAFTACERLPHTIGTISNLDEQLADRALRALEAEMQRRQRLFAEAGEGVDNLPAYLATDPPEPLPRLLLVIDEFAMLAKDFPEVLASLVSIGAVGRTLGVHMVLATQRPAGVVNDDILANTNLRIALRVQSRDDSTNVIGVASAAGIGRAQMGRAYVKLGQDEIVPVQTALVTGRPQKASAEPIEIRELGRFGTSLPHPSGSPKVPSRRGEANDLDRLIDAVVAANEAAGFAPPRKVWPDALGERVRLEDYATLAAPGDTPAVSIPSAGGVHADTVRVALADDPDRQRQIPVGWNPADGNLLAIGIPGSGTSTTLAAIALTLARNRSPEELDILCLDLGPRTLAPLGDLPHTIAYVGPGPRAKERQARFLRHLRSEFARRRADPSTHRVTLVLIDGLAALRDELTDEPDGQELLDALSRVYADGPAVGLHFAVATTRTKMIPPAIDEVTTQRWLYRLADPHDYSTAGIRGKMIPAEVPGRCVDQASKLQLHIATPDVGLEAAVEEASAAWAGASPKPDVVGALPSRVAVAEISAHLDLSSEPIRIPAGIREDTLAPAVLEAYEGEHVLIAGPTRSGKSTLLLAIAEMLRDLPDETRPKLHAIHDRRSPLADVVFDARASGPDGLSVFIADLTRSVEPTFLFIDDAERVDDSSGGLNDLTSKSPANVRIIAAGRTESLRGSSAKWMKQIRNSRCGVLLQPGDVYDGDLLGTPVPRSAPVALTAGRGYIFGGGTVALMHAVGEPRSPQEPA